MNVSTISAPPVRRVFTLLGGVLQKLLMVCGLVFIAGLIGVQSGRIDREGPLLAWLFAADAAEAPVAQAAETDAQDAAYDPLSPRLRNAMSYVSRRYKVATEALRPVFEVARSVGEELNLDPLLIIAVIGVESSFNPFSQSVFGAQGLMQVVPRFHHDKLPDDASSFLDPATNIQVGAQVLKESIARNGSLEAGLQQFGGASSDASRRYATKVLAELQRLERAAQGLRAA